MIQLPVRALHNQLPLLSVGSGVVAVTLMFATIAMGLADSARHRSLVRQTLARSLAEELAASLAAGGPTELTRHGLHATGRRVERGARVDLEVAVADASGGVHEFRGDLLPGALPRSIGLPLSIATAEDATDRSGAPEWSWLSAPGVPQPHRLTEGLPEVELPEVEYPPRQLGLVQDPSLALLRMRAGTDQDDFVFDGRDGRSRRPLVPTSGVVRVPGNLWVVDSTGVLTVELAEVLTLIVDGNVYFDADLRVVGRGDLVIVARAITGSVFVDADMDGRYSSRDGAPGGARYVGFLEGSGTVHLGVPGGPSGRPLSIDATLVVGRDVHLRRARAQVHGGLLLGSNLRAVDDAFRLRPTGRRLVDVNRRRVPGFAVRGAPRPSALVRADTEPFSRVGSSNPVGRR